MFYIIGDTHSDFKRFTKEQFPIQVEMTKNDYIIICGDFGGVWTFKEEKLVLFEFIEGWYNRRRIHSAIGDQIPYDIEKMSA